MVITDKLRQLIFKELYKELGDCEIIPYESSVWFINRDNKYWYFELDKEGTLWWRYDFFNSFFKIFSIVSDDFCPILSSWVEEVLNHKVSTAAADEYIDAVTVEEVLNHKVSTASEAFFNPNLMVEEVLNHKVSTSILSVLNRPIQVEEALNHKVTTTYRIKGECSEWMEDASATNRILDLRRGMVEDVLNHKVSKTNAIKHAELISVEEVLNNKVSTTHSSGLSCTIRVEQALNQ
jgi:hypothetical protein